MVILFICLGAMRQRQPAQIEHVLLSQRIKQFLCTFKNKYCQNGFSHCFELCHDFHNKQDRRRNPYINQSFLYYPSDICPCIDQNCNKCHSNYELCYHPLLYKTTKCNNYYCNIGLLCNLVHQNQINLLNRYQFFRFDLETFKTEICPHRQQNNNLHQLASCHYYHNDSDRRRNPRKVTYCHVQCSKGHCNDPQCIFAHNKIEQLYHPSRYKTKYCQSYINKKTCQYHQYCSFAHSDIQIKIELLHELVRNQDFLDYKYKTVWCPYTNQHDRANCSYAHNFQDYRRDPKKKIYTPEICPHWTKGKIQSIEDSGCPYRMDCPKSHGWLQKKYHPDLKKWENGSNQSDIETPSEKQDSSKSNSKPKPQNVLLTTQKDNTFGPGAPFFKRQRQTDRSQSEPKNERAKTIQKNKTEKRKDKKWNYFILLPEQSFSSQNNENQCIQAEEEVNWKTDKGDKEEEKMSHSPLFKQIVKRRKSEYTKSLKQVNVDIIQLLVRAGVEEKVSGISQLQLIKLQSKRLDQIGLTGQDKEAVIDTLRQYSTTHKMEKVKYTDSMVKLFRLKSLSQTLDKLRKKGVSQNLLQCLSSSSIKELSFLEQDEKEMLPKIMQQYADDRAFRELNQLIKKETLPKTSRSKNQPRGWFSFK